VPPTTTGYRRSHKHIEAGAPAKGQWGRWVNSPQEGTVGGRQRENQTTTNQGCTPSKLEEASEAVRREGTIREDNHRRHRHVLLLKKERPFLGNGTVNTFPLERILIRLREWEWEWQRVSQQRERDQ
jgi:hypothetical protein